MKRSRFTESQIVEILKEADTGLPVNEVWRKHGISSATYYVLQVEGQVRRIRCFGASTSQRARSGEQPTQKDVCGVGP